MHLIAGQLSYLSQSCLPDHTKYEITRIPTRYLPIYSDTLLGETQRLSHVLSDWREKTAIGSIQFIVRPKPVVDPSELEAAGSGLVRVYHRLYGDYESYLSYIVTPATEASQVLQQAIEQLSTNDDPDHFELVLKTGTKGIIS